MWGLQGSGCFRQAASRFGGEKNLFKARSHWSDAANYGVHPLADGSVGVMVEGVHTDIAEAVLFSIAVPTLPHRSRAVFHSVEPRGIIFLKKKTVGEIGPAKACQDGAEEGSSQKARGEVIVTC